MGRSTGMPGAEVIPESTYEPAYFERLAAVEDQHFWFGPRNRIIATVTRQVTARLANGYRVLEVGCGTGNVLRVLEQTCRRGSVFGMDLFGEGLQYARQRTSCSLVRGDVHRTPFNTPFDVIGLFDVLEHLPDDQQVLRDLYKMLVPGGTLLLTVPAHAYLWSYSDEAAHHCRRYELKDLEAKLQENGYQVSYTTQFMMSILPLVWLWRRVARTTGHHRKGDMDSAHSLTDKELRVNPMINSPLRSLLSQEARLIEKRLRLPYGTSILAIACKDMP